MPNKQKNPANQAVGSFEAAAILGVHFTIPRLMAASGKLTARHVRPGRGSRPVAIYDGGECDQDYLDYEEAIATGTHTRRPRSWTHLRRDVLKHLAGVEPVDFDDAIGAQEAGDLLGVHCSLVPRMCRGGKIVGRIAWSQRSGAARLWIISRRSCLENAKMMKAREAAGKKQGVPRSKKMS